MSQIEETNKMEVQETTDNQDSKFLNFDNFAQFYDVNLRPKNKNLFYFLLKKIIFLRPFLVKLKIQ